jgi:hypothetical protein
LRLLRLSVVTPRTTPAASAMTSSIPPILKAAVAITAVAAVWTIAAVGSVAAVGALASIAKRRLVRLALLCGGRVRGAVIAGELARRAVPCVAVARSRRAVLAASSARRTVIAVGSFGAVGPFGRYWRCCFGRREPLGAWGGSLGLCVLA